MGRGQSKLKSEGAAVFRPMRTDEISEKLSNASNLKFSRTTITMKDENGKTTGMVRGLARLSDLTGSQEFAAYQNTKKVGLDLKSMSDAGMSRKDIYLDGSNVYVLNNTRTSKFIAGLNKTQAKAFPKDVEKNKKRNELLKNAESKGAIVINY